MAILHTEYLIFSALSYCVFGKQDLNKNVFELLDDDNMESRERILLKNDVFFAFDFLGSWKTIGKNLLDFLKEWYVVEIMDKTDDGDSKVKSGFYGIAFGKKDKDDNYKEIVIAYRGSQLFPIKEAYRDFVETDFKIGLGKKPKQFDEGFELYKSVIEKYPYEEVRLTGHSLGGGIAQYVAVMSELATENNNFVPKTVTFNGVGILVDGMFKIEDFIDYEKSLVLIKNWGHENKWDKISKVLQGFFTKKMEDIIKKKELILSDMELKSFYSQFFFITGHSIKEEDIKLLTNSLLTHENIENLDKVTKLIKEFSENTKYLKKVKNFAHSEDFTASFLPHIGRTILIDKRLSEKKNSVYKKFPLNIKAFQKEMMTYHLFDIFIPYISINYGVSSENREFYLAKNLNFLYVAASIRKLIYEEKFSKSLLVFYYTQKMHYTFAELNMIKDLMIKEIEESKESFIFKEQIIDSLKNSDESEFKNIWFEIIDRLPSPFEQKDIYDHILYVYNVKKLKNLIRM